MGSNRDNYQEETRKKSRNLPSWGKINGFNIGSRGLIPKLPIQERMYNGTWELENLAATTSMGQNSF